MQLLQYPPQLPGNWEAQVACILKKTDTLVTDVKENHCSSNHSGMVQHLHINDIGDSHHDENQGFPKDSLKSNVAGKLAVYYGANNAGEIIANLQMQEVRNASHHTLL